ncbi:MAG: ABC transporter ATP-binding protein [Phycisphaerales bacterium]
MLRFRRTLVWAMVFAVLSAVGLGTGLMSLGPMLGLVLGEGGRSLPQLAHEFNAENSWISIPEWFINVLPTDPFRGVVLIVVGLGVLTVLGSIANFMHQLCSVTVVTKTVAGVRRDCFRRVIQMPMGRIVSRGPSEFIARIIRDASELQGGLIALTSKAAAQVSKGIAAFLVALWFSWQLALVALIVTPVLAVVLKKLGTRIRRGARGSLEAQEELLRIASETLRGIRAVKANTAERESAAHFHQKNKMVVQQELRVRLAKALSSPIVETLAIFAIGILATIAAKQIIDGVLDFTNFLLAIGSLAVAGSSFRPLAGLINEMQAASAPGERLLQLLEQPREVERDLGRPLLGPHRNTLEFRNVSFTHEDAEAPALRNISLTVQHGEKLAIVGPNGSGKTTLLALVPRLLVPQSGSVLIDGVDIAGVNLKSLRRQIGVVTQETVLFRGSVADNIAMGADRPSRSEVIDAARRAHAEEFILQLPSGYDTILAEQGASLSGGQRQRLAIARAVLREPSILILDEATSQIDSESESHINAALDEFCEGRTSLLIAHRLSTVLKADRIVVMADGCIIDVGTHDELMSRCDQYQRLAHHQFLPAPTDGDDLLPRSAPSSKAVTSTSRRL